MGEEISHSRFTERDLRRFQDRLVQETEQLGEWFRNRSFSAAAGVTGLELEGWLLDGHGDPAPCNEAFLRHLDDPLVVPELSRFNFEINTCPQPPGPHRFRAIHDQLQRVWQRCEDSARELQLMPLLIGTLPTLQDDAMTLENMSPMQRYFALNQRVLEGRQGQPLTVDISGAEDHLRVTHHDVMTEAATTSLQMHLQLDTDHAARFFNAAHILAAPMVAASGNSPYLFGHELWEESRVPLFEQSVAVPAFYDGEGHLIERVTFGTRYVQSSLQEIFEENAAHFPVLLPLLYPPDAHHLEHLRLHNGTIWRWNRPLVGFNETGEPTLRLEHRVVPAGPSLPDVVANMVFFHGLIHHLAGQDDAPEERLQFSHAVANFYQAARHGLEATVFWLDGHEHNVRHLLLDSLIPAAGQALQELGIAADDIDHYLFGIFAERVRTGQTGAAWQRGFVARHGRDFHALVRTYQRHQASHRPVHEWPL